MSVGEQFIFEAVVLARAFGTAPDRASVAAAFPASVVALYDVSIADPRWDAAAGLADRALIIASVLAADAALAARLHADLDAGRLGLGAVADGEVEAAIGALRRRLERTTEMAGPDDGLLGGNGAADPWEPPGSGAPPTGEVPITPTAPPSIEPEADDGGGFGSDDSSSPPRPRPPAMAPPPSMPAPTAPAPSTPPPDDASPDTEGPPPADTIRTWLNAELNDAAAPLLVGAPRVLAVFLGERSEAAVASTETTLAIPRADASLDVTVELASSDFSVPPGGQLLRVARDGRSSHRALFEITPVHDGPSTVSVLVSVKGNFLQRLEVTFDVGTGAQPDVTAFGRPLGAAAVLQERVATMHFLPAVGGYQVIAKAVTPDPVMVLITPDELAARIAGVRDALLTTVSDPRVALNLDIPADLGTAALQKLAFEGFRLFQAIFAGPTASAQLKAIGRWLQETLAEETTTLQVVSSGFPVPWALMYLTPRFDATALSWDDFIGMRHVVEQIPMTEIDVVPPAPTITSTPELSVRVIYNEGIDDSMPSRPIAAQRAYWAERGVAVTEGTRADDFITRALGADASDKVLYLYCHAVAASADPDDSHLILSGKESVTLGQLSVFAPIEDALRGRPLVFLNACESGELTPAFYDGFVPYFLAKGARGVIGTECKTPGLFASEWSKAFFDELFAGKALGEVVLELRRRFLATHNNPLGLLYGVHCDADTRVDPALTAPSS
ncbi:CHAT domain-containing protein [Microbacterium sp. I2]|uniref:CHAT domain-containing protein n=1 Tax=Microbacterium sp. I2 TaxID=3391826 RepID=UPI003ED88365